MGIEFCNLDPCCTMHRHGMEKSLQGHQNKMNKGLQGLQCSKTAQLRCKAIVKSLQSQIHQTRHDSSLHTGY